jgi:non-ribosomal peptide synthetase component F
MNKSPLLMAALLGVLKSGSAYMPIEQSLPQERMRYMLDDSGCEVILSDRDTLGSSSGLASLRAVDLDAPDEPGDSKRRPRTILVDDVLQGLYVARRQVQHE